MIHSKGGHTAHMRFPIPSCQFHLELCNRQHVTNQHQRCKNNHLCVYQQRLLCDPVLVTCFQQLNFQTLPNEIVTVQMELSLWNRNTRVYPHQG